MESYMSLNEDNQRKMLVQTKYLSDLTEKTVKQQTATTTILKNQVEELMGFFQEALELICTLQIDNEVSALERNRLRVLVRKEESDYQDQISLMQEEVEGIRATVESLVTDVQSNLQKHTTSTENGVDAILVKLEKALTACLDKKILVCESDFKLKNRTVMVFLSHYMFDINVYKQLGKSFDNIRSPNRRSSSPRGQFNHTIVSKNLF